MKIFALDIMLMGTLILVIALVGFTIYLTVTIFLEHKKRKEIMEVEFLERMEDK